MKYYNREGYITGCFTVFESLIKGCKNEDEFISRKEEFYQIFKKSAHESKLDKDEVDYIWSRLKVMIENKRKELFEKKQKFNDHEFDWFGFDFGTNTKASWNADSINWEELKKMIEDLENRFGFGKKSSYGFNPNWNNNFYNRHSYTYNNFGFQNDNIEVSFKYFELTKTATEEQLTKAYRIKSLKTHPDKPGGSKELFQECQNHKENCLIFIKRGF